MKFVDYIKKCIKEDLEFDAIIGDVEMPATFCFWDAMKITDYCMQKYGKLLNSNCEVKPDITGRHTDVVIVHCDDEAMGTRFTWAVAGYITDTEYQKLFDCN